MRLRLLSGLAAAAPLLTSCALPGTTCQLTQPNPLPVYFNTAGIPLIIAGVNDVPAAMLFDTGATTSFVTPDIAKQADLPLSPMDRTVMFSGVGGVQTAQLSSVKEFLLGDAVGHNMEIFVLPIDPGRDSHGQPLIIDGDIADDINKNYDIDIDFPNGQVTYYNAGWCANVAPPWTGSATAVPIRVGYFGDVYLPVTIDGKSFTAFLDTGTTVSDIPPALFTSSGLWLEGKLVKKRAVISAIGGMVREDYYRLHELSIGGQTMQDPIFGVENAEEEIAALAPGQRANLRNIEKVLRLLGGGHAPQGGPFIDWTKGQDITLGENFIRAHRIFLSYSTHMLYIQN